MPESIAATPSTIAPLRTSAPRPRVRTVNGSAIRISSGQTNAFASPISAAAASAAAGPSTWKPCSSALRMSSPAPVISQATTIRRPTWDARASMRRVLLDRGGRALLRSVNPAVRGLTTPAGREILEKSSISQRGPRGRQRRDEARGNPPHHRDHRERPAQRRLLRRRARACGWSRRPSTRTSPTVYHLFYADEEGSAGSDLTFFEFPGVPQGRAGRRDGPPDRLAGRARPEALDFWEQRLAAARDRVRARGRRASLRRPRGPRARARASSSPATRR